MLASLSKTELYAGNSSHSRPVLVGDSVLITMSTTPSVTIRRTWGQSAGKTRNREAPAAEPGTLRDQTFGTDPVRIGDERVRPLPKGRGMNRAKFLVG